MEKFYIVEHKLIYDAETHTLTSTANNERIALAIPASLCFRLLIKKQGHIVTQAELLHEAWGERGMNVTQNTLHQNISLLRKALSRLSVDASIIQTLPKRGFMIADSIDIVDQDYFDDINTEPIIQIEESPLISIKPNIPIVELEPPVECAQTPAKMSATSILMRYKYFVIIFFILLIALGSSYSKKQIENPFSSYLKLIHLKGCDVYRNNDLQGNNYYLAMVKKYQLDCSPGKVAYITNNYPSSRVSFIICRRPITSNGKSFCTSTYYLK